MGENFPRAMPQEASENAKNFHVHLLPHKRKMLGRMQIWENSFPSQRMLIALLLIGNWIYLQLCAHGQQCSSSTLLCEHLRGPLTVASVALQITCTEKLSGFQCLLIVNCGNLRGPLTVASVAMQITCTEKLSGFHCLLVVNCGNLCGPLTVASVAVRITRTEKLSGFQCLLVLNCGIR